MQDDYYKRELEQLKRLAHYRCPKCGSDDRKIGTADYRHSNFGWTPCECNKCGHKWDVVDY